MRASRQRRCSAIHSDSAALHGLVREMLKVTGAIRCMRDPTRGGLATVLNDIVNATGHGVRVCEAAIPIRDQVQSVCELLGYDPLYLACEGQLVAVVAATAADEAVEVLRRLAPECARIGRVDESSTRVVLETAFGGERVLDELEDDPLPRIC